jgi:hypothetical protein
MNITLELSKTNAQTLADGLRYFLDSDIWQADQSDYQTLEEIVQRLEAYGIYSPSTKG